ncbi:MAG: hypothetical protein QM715_10605 [Nibricoccus sp.]
MSRRKRTSSRALQNASARAAGIESIDPALDLGGGLTVAAYNAAIQDARDKQTKYNTLLAESDEAANVFEAAEANLRDLTERMLAAVSAKFGRDSNEYEQAGGKRKSDRKRAVRAVAASPAVKAA